MPSRLDTIATSVGRAPSCAASACAASASPSRWRTCYAVVRVVDERYLQHEGKTFHTPASDRLADVVLREPLREFLPHDERYFDAFDRFEYLLSLAFVDAGERRGSLWRPPTRSAGASGAAATAFTKRSKPEPAAPASAGASCATASCGSLHRFLEIKDGFDEQIRHLPW